MKIEIRNRCSDFDSYRAARVKSLFNAESGCNFNLDAELPIDDGDWRVGLVVGPSGSGKTSIGRAVWGAMRSATAAWPWVKAWLAVRWSQAVAEKPWAAMYPISTSARTSSRDLQGKAALATVAASITIKAERRNCPIPGPLGELLLAGP